MRVDLGDETWAELRHPSKIPHGKTMEYRRTFYEVVALSAEVDTTAEDADQAAGRAIMENGGLNTMEDLANALVLAVVGDWSFGPVDLPTLLEVPTVALDAIQKRCASEEYTKVLQPDFGPDGDEDSPTGLSAP